MDAPWKDQLYLQRSKLAQQLRGPIAELATHLVSAWPVQKHMENVMLDFSSRIPYCNSLYIVNPAGIQISNNIGPEGIEYGHYQRDRSHRPYMNETMPAWGFLLSDAYISEIRHRPCLTALQVLRAGDHTLGYLGADFNLCNLPASQELYKEPKLWRQVKGDPAIRGLLFQQTREESPMDRNLPQVLSILEELITMRGVFQAQLHFSSSQATIWLTSDPWRYRILDIDALNDPDICLLYPQLSYPPNTLIPQHCITPILDTFGQLRHADENIYLRVASINLFNGMISMTFSCDGSHYMPYDEFLRKNLSFWLGAAA